MLEIKSINPTSGFYVDFHKPIPTTITFDSFYWTAKIKPLGISVIEKTLEELETSIIEYVESDYMAYALADDNRLTSGAQKIKKWFLSNSNGQWV